MLVNNLFIYCSIIGQEHNPILITFPKTGQLYNVSTKNTMKYEVDMTYIQ